MSPQVGDRVRVLDGPFVDFEGIVLSVHPDGKLTIRVNMFGRETSVQLYMGQVERL